MALFTDGPISSAKELQEYEAAVLTDANAEGIDVSAKVTLAQQELANELILFLLRRAPFRDYQPNVRRSRGLTDVVVTDALLQWHIYKTIAMVYRDAYNNQLNDRYQGKWNEYEQLAKGSSRTYFQLGVGVVADPLPRATMPALSSVAGNGSGATFYVIATWTNSAGQEGAPSPYAQLSTSPGEILSVGLTGTPPQNAIGWNAYVGPSPGAVTRQNDSPVGIGSNWIMTGVLGAGGAPVPMGQKPDWFIVDHRTIERG
jgi:hypothetical protein